MVNESVIQRLSNLCNNFPDQFFKIDITKFEFKESESKWSKKEILGHLIDSAANNHQRFIRAQYENEPIIFYDQNEWVNLTNYQSMNSVDLINLWKAYNQLILNIIIQIPNEKLTRLVGNQDGKFTLLFIIEDYVNHLQHHVYQILEEKIE
mgnify:CR=1 FL=1